MFDAPIDHTQQIIDVQPTYILVARPLRTAKAQTSDVSKRLVYTSPSWAEDHRKPHGNSPGVWSGCSKQRCLPAVHDVYGEFPLVPRFARLNLVHLAGGLVHRPVKRVPVYGRGAGIEPHAGRSPGLGDGLADHLRGKHA